MYISSISGDFEYEVDHAVVGPDYVRGYAADGTLIVSFEGVDNLDYFDFDDDPLSPEACLGEPCNAVHHVNGQLVRGDGIPVPPEAIKSSVTYETMDMLYNAWEGNAYSFEDKYPKDQYDISISVSPTAIPAAYNEFCNAMICGSPDSNVATALGELPNGSIPIIVKAVKK